MSWKKLFTNGAFPEKDDPRYASHREAGESAGRRVGQLLRLDKLSAFIYRHSSAHMKAFLFITFGIVGGLFIYNTINMVVYMTSKQDTPRRPVTEYVDSLMERSAGHDMITNE